MPASKPSGTSVLGAVLGTVGFSILAGVLTTVMVAPAIAVTGVTATSTIGIFDNLPDYITIGAGAQANQIVAKNADGSTFQIATVYKQNRNEVPLSAMSVYLQDAAISGEDSRFYDHGGVDLPSVIRAALGQATGSSSSGASTLTMQLVRNILIQQIFNDTTHPDWTAQQENQWKLDEIAKATNPTLDRKIREMKLAIGLEKKYSKAQIMEAYLNIAGFGGNTYGVQAAAQQYFGVNASDLNIAQSAAIIAIVQNPSTRGLNNSNNWAYNQSRRDYIIQQMAVHGYITNAERDAALAIQNDDKFIQNNQVANGCLSAPAGFGFACDFALRQVQSLTALGSTPAQRQANWDNGGYTLVTSINPTIQTSATDTLQHWTPNTETRFDLGSAATSLEVGSGRIVSMAENKDYNNTPNAPATATSVNFNADQNQGGSVGFQPGSTYKPYVLLAFLAAGHGINESFNAGVRSLNQSQFGSTTGCSNGGGSFKVNNDGNETGQYTVRQATAKSINAVFLLMATELDQCAIRDMAASMGVHNANGNPQLETYPTCNIGVCGINISPVTAAAAFATIANQGQYCAPRIIDDVIDHSGKSLGGTPQACSQSNATPDVANTAAFAMQGVFQGGGTAPAANPNDGTTYIGKTGTTDNAVHLWLVGSSTKVSTALWIGNIQGQQNLRSISVMGYQAALLRNPVFKALSQVIDKQPGYKGTAFPAPAANLQTGIPVYVPTINGLDLASAQQAIQLAGLNFADGGQVASNQPVGTVVASNPASGASVSRGTTVTVQTSNGQGVAVPTVVGMQYAAAKAQMDAVGLTNVVANCVTPNPGNTVPAGQVIDQNPAGTTVVDKTTVVTLTMYSYAGLGCGASGGAGTGAGTGTGTGTGAGKSTGTGTGG